MPVIIALVMMEIFGCRICCLIVAFAFELLFSNGMFSVLSDLDEFEIVLPLVGVTIGNFTGLGEFLLRIFQLCVLISAQDHARNYAPLEVAPVPSSYVTRLAP